MGIPSNTLGAAFLLISTGIATAESDSPLSFHVTPECAEQALLQVFEEPFEILHEQGGVGGFRTSTNEKTGMTSHISSIVNIAPNGNLSSINVQIDLVDPLEGVDLTTVTSRDYRSVPQGELSLNGDGSNLTEVISRAFNDKLDAALRECSPQLIGFMSYPPFNIG